MWGEVAPQTRAPAPAPNSAARRRPLGDPTAWWAARSRAAPASMPPDGDDGAPGWGRLRRASGSIDHRPCSRPPRLSMNGIVQGGGEGGATPGGGGGCGGGGRAGGGGVAMQPPPASSSRCGNSCGGGAGVTLETMDDKQTTIKSWRRVAFNKGVSILCPYQPPPKRHICRWDLGEGVAGFDLARKGRAGDEIDMRWMMTTTRMARGGSKGKVSIIVFQSISAY
jgi:hypothetical protein